MHCDSVTDQIGWPARNDSDDQNTIAARKYVSKHLVDMQTN
jgi:hypothetical protein